MNKPTYTFAQDHEVIRCATCGTTHHFHPCPNCLGERCEGRWLGGSTRKPIDEKRLRAMWVDPTITVAQMAEDLGCAQSSVSRNAKRLELGPRPPLQLGGAEVEVEFRSRRHDADVFGDRTTYPVDTGREVAKLELFNRSFDEAIEEAPEREAREDKANGEATLVCLAMGLLVTLAAGTVALLL